MDDDIIIFNYYFNNCEGIKYQLSMNYYEFYLDYGFADEDFMKDQAV